MGVLQYELGHIAEITGGQLQGTSDILIQSVYTDSRQLQRDPHALFVAIKGANHNGNDFVEDLYAQGARNFMVSEEGPWNSYSEANFVVVDDGLRALQAIATHHRAQFQGKIMAITGSYGKTIVKEWLYHCLSSHHNICRSPKSYNSQLGVALSLLQLREDHDLAIIEAGISQPGEMSKLQQMIKPDYGVLTSIGDAHLENFESLDALRAEKMLLFDGVDWLITHESDELDSFMNLKTPFSDKASSQNARLVAAICEKLGLDEGTIRSQCDTLPPVAMRLELLEGTNGCKILNDAYNSDINGLRIALDYQRESSDLDKTVILSDILLDQGDSAAAYERVFHMLNEYQVNKLLVVGSEIKEQRHLYAGSHIHGFDTTDQLIQHLSDFPPSKEIILIKGARSFGFERVATMLEYRPHATYLEINLNNLADNIGVLRSKLEPGVKTMAMVKALGYGAGGTEIARALAHHHVDYFGVAYANEGVELRRAGINTPVMVLNSDLNTLETMVEHYLEPVVFSLEQLDETIRFLIGKGISGFPIHVEFDSGMHRLGFSQGDITKLAEMILAQPEVLVRSVFSHLAVADEADKDDFTRAQIQRFGTFAESLQEQLPYPLIRHICNTAGILTHPEAHYEMVRMGIGLYGIDPLADKVGLKQVSALYTHISQTKAVKAGEPVGYGCSEIPETDIEIGIIPIGYADGLSRSLSNGVGSLVHVDSGTQLPIIGKVCMDMTMVRLLDSDAQKGDRLEIFGPNQSIDAFAETRGTIPYEVMTSISSRVKRVFVSE